MKKIGQLYGIDFKITEGVKKDEIVVISPTKEMSEKIQSLLEKFFQPGKWEFVKKDE